ncbi:MAG: MarR family transcriptional regulator [Spirochaetaceae bacterium]|nr:MarR family transcriptional regulator [Spirochaetaceae bacterium]
MFNLDDCFALITSRSGKVFAKTLDEQLNSHGMPRSQWIAMYYIHNSEDITQKGLADKMANKEPTVARMLQKMESDGFLYRSGCNDDKRIKYLKLTEKGTNEFLKLMPIVETFKNNTIDGICEKDLQLFKSILNKMIENTLKF